MLFIAVAGPVKGVENQLFNALKKLYGNEIIEKDIVENLYSLELVDWFKNEITKISDQSLGNYIMYYVLFEKKWISVESLISIGFPYYRNKVIYVLNTLMEIFDSENWQNMWKIQLFLPGKMHQLSKQWNILSLSIELILIRHFPL